MEWATKHFVLSNDAVSLTPPPSMQLHTHFWGKKNVYNIFHNTMAQSIFFLLLVPVYLVTFLATPSEAEECGSNSSMSTFPSRKGSCQLLLTCCATDDGIKRDCCSLIYPKRGKEEGCSCTQKWPSSVRPYDGIVATIVPPTAERDESTIEEQIKQLIRLSENDSKRRLSSPDLIKCHVSTSGAILPATQRIINKCCHTQGKGGVNCLALAYPSLPWEERCGRCYREISADELLSDCCHTNDGVERDCCLSIRPHLNPEEMSVCRQRCNLTLENNPSDQGSSSYFYDSNLENRLRGCKVTQATRDFFQSCCTLNREEWEGIGGLKCDQLVYGDCHQPEQFSVGERDGRGCPHESSFGSLPILKSQP